MATIREVTTPQPVTLPASVGEVCTTEVLAASPDDEVSDAVRLMTDRSVRRLAVVQDGELVGVVSLGDLASEFDPASALGEISRASAND